MVKQDVKERRHFVRAKRILSIQFRIKKSSRKNYDKSWGLSTTQDMSLSGLSFYTDREYAPGDILYLHVVMSGVLDIYKGYGKVVRSDRKKSGVCYLVAVEYADKESVLGKKSVSYRPNKMPRTESRL